MSSPETVFRLVYVSRSKPLAPDRQERMVADILAASRRNNADLGITGALLFSADCFAQSLEGSMQAVEALFERIQMDDRHTDAVILGVEPAAEREFGNWSMAYAGHHDDDRMRFDAVSGMSGSDGVGAVLDTLRGIVLRAAPRVT